MELQVHLLNDLREALVQLDKKNWKKAGFNMGYWARNKLPETPELNCGTVCCAFGVGVSLPSWRAAGVKMVIDDNFSGVRFKPEPYVAQTMLGLSDLEWSYIFGIVTYKEDGFRFRIEDISPADVIKHIDNFFIIEDISPADVIKHIDNVLAGNW